MTTNCMHAFTLMLIKHYICEYVDRDLCIIYVYYNTYYIYIYILWFNIINDHNIFIQI